MLRRNHREFPEIFCIVSRMELREQAVSGPAHEFEEFARDCVRLADEGVHPMMPPFRLSPEREAARPASPSPCEFRQGRQAGADRRKIQSGNASRDDRDNTLARE